MRKLLSTIAYASRAFTDTTIRTDRNRTGLHCLCMREISQLHLRLSDASPQRSQAFTVDIQQVHCINDSAATTHALSSSQIPHQYSIIQCLASICILLIRLSRAYLDEPPSEIERIIWRWLERLYTQSNGKAELMVQTIKKILKKEVDSGRLVYCTLAAQKYAHCWSQLKSCTAVAKQTIGHQVACCQLVSVLRARL